MKFLSTLDRIRRSAKTGDESSDRIEIVRFEQDAPSDQLPTAAVSLTDILVTKETDQTIIIIGAESLSDISRARSLGPQLIRLLEAEKTNSMLIDLRQVHQLSSESLNQLIAINCHARSLGVRLILANLCQPLGEVFRITRLDRLFELATSD
jgi:anti-anti-sigma factor